MGIRRKTGNRFTIFRDCDVCGQRIVTTAETPWMRQVAVVEDGKRRQRTKYYCSTECLQASYKHKGWYDGKADLRREEKDKNRDPQKRAEQWKRYYAKHGEAIRQKRRERYRQNRDAELASNRYQRRKRKLLKQEEKNESNGEA